MDESTPDIAGAIATARDTISQYRKDVKEPYNEAMVPTLRLHIILLLEELAKLLGQLELERDARDR